MIHIVKVFSLVNEAEVEMFFWKPLAFLCNPTDVDNLISDSFAFSKSSLNIWKFMVHVLLKPSLENFEHYFASMWDECNCAVVWTFFDIAFLWNWNENWPFLVLSQQERPTLPYTGVYFQNQICGKIFIGGNMFWTRGGLPSLGLHRIRHDWGDLAAAAAIVGRRE